MNSSNTCIISHFGLPCTTILFLSSAYTGFVENLIPLLIPTFIAHLRASLVFDIATILAMMLEIELETTEALVYKV